MNASPAIIPLCADLLCADLLCADLPCADLLCADLLCADLLAIAVGAVQGAKFAAQFRDRRLDLLLSLLIAPMHVGSLYAIASVSGAGTLVTPVALDAPIFITAVVCTAVTFGVRVLAVLVRWSLPEQ